MAECAVIGIKRTFDGENDHFALIVRDPKSATPVTAGGVKSKPMSLASSEKGVISKFAVPEKMLFVDALAMKRASGKFDKKTLRGQIQ